MLGRKLENMQKANKKTINARKRISRSTRWIIAVKFWIFFFLKSGYSTVNCLKSSTSRDTFCLLANQYQK